MASLAFLRFPVFSPMKVGLLVAILASTCSAQYASTAVTIQNRSPYTVRVSVSSQSKTLNPGAGFTFYPVLYFANPANYLQGSARVGVSISYQGTVRTGSIPIFARGGFPYAYGTVIRRSPGIVGITNSGSP